MGKAFVINPDRCNGCYACQLACKDEHCGVDWSPFTKEEPLTGQFWIKIQEIERGTVPKVFVSYVPHMCMHCEECASAKVCEQGAFTRLENGLSYIDPAKCNGCNKCVEACPYDAVFFNDDLQLAQKCTGCVHLLEDGWTTTRCAEACATGGLRFGDEEEFAEEIAAAESLIENAPNGAKVYYINLPKRFVAGEVYDPETEEVIIGATVTLYNPETEDVWTTETDDFGDFWFRQMNPAKYQVYVTVDGYLTRMIDADVIDKDANVGAIAMYHDLLG